MRLAEYNLETGKFERFLELGTGQGYFGYYGRMIKISNPSNDDYQIEIDKDEKDPLNRFNGLFNGRTYGGGRFVLVNYFQYLHEFWQDTFLKNSWGGDSLNLIRDMRDLVMMTRIECSNDVEAGNLHENPELWGKV